MALFFPVLLAIVLSVIAAYWKTLVQIWKFRKLDDVIPGLPTNPILGNAAMFAGKNTEEIAAIFKNTANDLQKQGKNLMRFRLVGKLHVWPLNGKTIAKLLESTTELRKGEDYGFLDPWLGGGLLFEHGEKWRSHRKMLTPTFHFAKLDGYLEVFNAESKIFIECLEKNITANSTVDVFPFIKRCTLDIICEAAMGTKVDAQYNQNHTYVRAVEGINKLAVFHSLNPHLQNSLIFWALGYKKQKDDYLHTLKTFTSDVIAERKAAIASGEVEKETQKRKMNFLDILLSNGECNELTSEEIRQEVDNFMFAGHDTTTASLSWMVWNLAHHQDIQQKVYEEIVSIFGEDPNEDVTTDGVKQLDYTERVLKESKRMSPPVPSVIRNLLNDMELDGCVIPAGANVIIPPIVLHSNPQVFTNPEKFDPDRFLPEEVAKRNAYDYIPFSAGLRNCIGQKFSQLNEKVMLIHLLKSYKIEPTCGYNDTKPTFEIIAKPSHGIPVKLVKRQSCN